MTVALGRVEKSYRKGKGEHDAELETSIYLTRSARPARIQYVGPAHGALYRDRDLASFYLSVSPGSYTFNVMATQNDAITPVSAQLKPWTVTSIFAISQINNGSSDGKLQFIQAQITGMPGMPGTGSDPHAQPVSAPLAPSQILASWPLALPILALIGSAGVIVVSRRRRAKAFSGTR